MSSGWHIIHCMSSGRLSRNWYLIRMSYGNAVMSSGWHRLPFVSHSDEIANFDFPHHAVALQRFRRNPITCYMADLPVYHRGYADLVRYATILKQVRRVYYVMKRLLYLKHNCWSSYYDFTHCSCFIVLHCRLVLLNCSHIFSLTSITRSNHMIFFHSNDVKLKANTNK